jgi:hypothetical protein
VGGTEWDVRLLHLVMNWRPSLTNSRGISRNSFAWSIVLCDVCGFVCRVCVSLERSLSESVGCMESLCV